MSAPGFIGWLISKLRRYPAVIVCAFGATLGITLGNLLVPSLDQALGISEVYVPPPVLANPARDIPAGPPTGNDPTDEAQDEDGGGTQNLAPGGQDHDDSPRAGEPSQPNSAPSSAGPGAPPPTTPGTETPAGETPPGTTNPSPDPVGTSPVPTNHTPSDTPGPAQTPNQTVPTAAPSPHPSPTGEPEICLELDLSPLELALCLLTGQKSTSTPPDPSSAPSAPSTAPAAQPETIPLVTSPVR